MKQQLIIASAILLFTAAITGCTSELQADGNDSQQISISEITAYNGDYDTKTILGENEISILWQPKDEIKVFYGSASVKFQSMNTEPEECTIFSSNTSLLYGGTESSSSYIWATYPYTAGSTHDKTTVSITVPSSQTPTAGSFYGPSFPSVGRSKDTNIAFYNVCGGIRFSVSQEGIKRVVISGNNDEYIAGTVKVGFNEDERPVVNEVVSGNKVITLSTNSGFEVGKWYYVSMLPVRLESGLKLSFYTSAYDTPSQESATLVINGSREVRRSIFAEIENADEDLEYAVRVYSLVLNTNSLFIERSATAQLTYTINPKNATCEWVNWTSSDENIATVSQDGVVTGVSDGTCTISVQSDNGRSTSCTVYVSSPSVVTEEATNVGYGSVDLRGIMSAQGIEDYTTKQATFRYSTSASNLEDLISSGSSVYANLESTSDGNYTYHYHLSGLKPSTTYYYVVCAKVGSKSYYGEVKSFTTNTLSDLSDAVVNLGLSVNWSSTNVGADLPEEIGNRYAWGEVSTKATYTTENYLWFDYHYWESDDDADSSTYVNKYGSSDFTNADPFDYFSHDWCNDGRLVLEPEDDAARVEWRGTWRMPTLSECEELLNNCSVEEITYNNVRGLLCTSKVAGYTSKQIFLPYVSNNFYTYPLGGPYNNSNSVYCCCWSSSQDLKYPVNAAAVSQKGMLSVWRPHGLPVRPVKSK